MRKYLTLIAAAGLLVLSGCGTIGGGNDQGTENTIATGLTAISGTQQLYIANCITTQTFEQLCTDNKVKAKQASSVARTLSDDLVHTYEAGGNVDTLILQLGVDAANLVALWNDLQQKDNIAHHKAKLDPLTWITIAQSVIPVVIQIYDEIKGIGQVDTSKLDDLLKAVDANDDTIQKS